MTNDEDQEINNAMLRHESEYDIMDDVPPVRGAGCRPL
jgi:hypothetical protein